MGSYVLQFEWPDGVKVEADKPRALYGATVDVAQFSAAIVYAGVSFQDPAPTAYSILSETGEVVYRYPKEARTWKAARSDRSASDA
jgi:hypothetical protein